MTLKYLIPDNYRIVAFFIAAILSISPETLYGRLKVEKSPQISAMQYETFPLLIRKWKLMQRNFRYSMEYSNKKG